MTDLKREYVVEVALTGQTGDPPKTETRWIVVETTDNQNEAVRYAQQVHKDRGANTRVRQFWVQYGPTITVAGIPSKQPAAPATELTTVVCPNHGHQQARVYDVAVTVRCPECKIAMVPEEMARAMGSGDVVDLE